MHLLPAANKTNGKKQLILFEVRSICFNPCLTKSQRKRAKVDWRLILVSTANMDHYFAAFCYLVKDV